MDAGNGPATAIAQSPAALRYARARAYTTACYLLHLAALSTTTGVIYFAWQVKISVICRAQCRVIVQWRDWRINLQGCYDLRFPVFSRNCEDYDLALYVANWPTQRQSHWRQLLIARAIENLACVVGVNRIGTDARGLSYSGGSLAVAADGEILLDAHSDNSAFQVVLDGAALQLYRDRFPCQLDADSFQLQ